jgi:hypothetical protein
MTKDTGGSAFPEVSYKKPDGHGAHIMTVSGGMSLRDYFAAKVMQGDAGAGEEWGVNVSDEIINARVKLYWRIADAMIAERNKP